MSIELRKATASDINAMDALYHPYAGRHINRPRITEAVAEHPSVVALDASQLLGFSYCFRFAPDILELANIYIDKQVRSDGLGSRMVAYLRQQLKPGIKAIIAVNSDLYAVRDGKRRPDNFYIRNGFRIVTTTNESTVYWWDRE